MGRENTEKIEEFNTSNKEYKRQCKIIMGHFKAYKTETEKEYRDMEEIVINELEFEALVNRFFVSIFVDELKVDISCWSDFSMASFTLYLSMAME